MKLYVAEFVVLFCGEFLLRFVPSSWIAPCGVGGIRVSALKSCLMAPGLECKGKLGRMFSLPFKGLDVGFTYSVQIGQSCDEAWET